jgi:hypothetical protein
LRYTLAAFAPPGPQSFHDATRGQSQGFLPTITLSACRRCPLPASRRSRIRASAVGTRRASPVGGSPTRRGVAPRSPWPIGRAFPLVLSFLPARPPCRFQRTWIEIDGWDYSGDFRRRDYATTPLHCTGRTSFQVSGARDFPSGGGVLLTTTWCWRTSIPAAWRCASARHGGAPTPQRRQHSVPPWNMVLEVRAGFDPTDSSAIESGLSSVGGGLGPFGAGADLGFGPVTSPP